MKDATTISRFGDLGQSEEFLSADGRRYMKLGDEWGYVPDHVGRDEPIEGLGEETHQDEIVEEDLIRRRFEDDELVVRDANYGSDRPDERIRFFASEES